MWTDGRRNRFCRYLKHTVWAWVVAGMGLLASVAVAADAVTATTPDSQRIVSVNGAITEILFALGVDDRLVGVDTTSQWPPAVESLPRVGYQLSLSAEGIVALGPTLVIGTEAAGPESVLVQVRNAGIDVVQLPEPRTPDAIVQRVRDIARLVEREAEGEFLADELAGDIARLTARVARVAERPRTLFVLSVSRGAPLASGRGTAADMMIRLAGGINVIDEYEGYKPLNPEAIIVAAPDVLLVTTRTLESLGGVSGLKKVPGLGRTPAIRDGRVVAMDALYLLGFGPRTGRALAELADHLHAADQ